MELTHKPGAHNFPLPPPFLAAAAAASDEVQDASRGFLESALRGLELVLRRYQKIHEFTADKDCIFRIAHGTAEDEIALADGTQVKPGDPIIELHFWNEHLPVIPPEGPRISWGLVMHQRALYSFTLLAEHLLRDHGYDGALALRGEAVFTSRIGRPQMRRVAGRYGFQLFEDEPPLRRRFRFFWENFLLWGLVWTFNPGAMRGKTLINERFELWASREALLRRYTHPPAAAATEH